MLTPVPGLSPDRESLISISRTGLVHWPTNSKKVIEIQDNSLIMAAKHRRVLLGAVGALATRHFSKGGPRAGGQAPPQQPQQPPGFDTLVCPVWTHSPCITHSHTYARRKPIHVAHPYTTLTQFAHTFTTLTLTHDDHNNKPLESIT